MKIPFRLVQRFALGCRPWILLFGEDYIRVGVLGRIIHEPCVVAVRDDKAAINAEGLNLALPLLLRECRRH